MAPVIRTYQGKKPSLALKVPAISPFRKQDSFDRLFGQRRSAAHVFSSSSEASASHNRLGAVTPETISYDLSTDKKFLRSQGERQKLDIPVTPKWKRKIKKRAGKKTDIFNFEKLSELKTRRRLLKRKQVCKKKDALLKPLFQSTPVKHSFDDSLGIAFNALKIQDSCSRGSSLTAKTQQSVTEEKDTVESTASDQSSLSVKSEAAELCDSELEESDDHSDKVNRLEFGLTFTIAPSPIPACSMSNSAPEVSVKLCRESTNVGRLSGSSVDAQHSASAQSTPQVKPRVPSFSGDSVAFKGFDSGEITPTTLRKRYQWMEKAKSRDVVEETPRRAISMHDIILARASVHDESNNSDDTASTVRQPCKKLVTETSLSSPVNENVGTIADPQGARLSKEKMNLTSGSVRSSLHSKHYTTCDELHLTSSASSGDSPDSCRSGEDLSREAFNEQEEDEEDSLVNRPNLPSRIPLHSLYEQRTLEPLHENLEEHVEEMEEESSSLSSKSSPAETPDSSSNRTPNMRRKTSRYSEERSPTGRSSIGRALLTPDLNCVMEESDSDSVSSDQVGELLPLEHFTLIPGKKYRRSLSILRNLEDQRLAENNIKGRKFKESVEEVIRLQNTFCGDMSDSSISLQSLKQRLSVRRSSLMKQMTPPPRRRSTVRHTIYETPGSFSCRSTARDSLSILCKSFVDNTLLSPGIRSLDSIRPSFKPDVSHIADKDCSDMSPMAQHSNLTSPGDSDGQATYRDAILAICKQTDFVGFSDILKKEAYDGAVKLGEGVYGEVFGVRRGDEMTVVKIIPLEGNFPVNEADQKTYAEIIPELLISKELNSLRLEETSKNYNMAHGFVEILKISLVQGRYPPELLDLWRKFNVEKGSDNDNPKVFEDEQIYAVIEQGNGGKDLENYSFSTAKQVVSIFKQIAFSLAVAECALEFEHRDLHWGNVLVSRTKELQISFWLKGVEYKMPANGVKGTIIDYTLSRISYRSTLPLSCDLSKDPELFLGSGDFQFDVYRQMKKDVANDWSRHVPKTNVRWLHYLLDKMLKKVKYQRKGAKVHTDNMVILQQIESWIDSCDSAYSVVLQLETK